MTSTIPTWPDLPGADGNVYPPIGGLERFVFNPPCECSDCETGFYKRSEQIERWPFLTYRRTTSSGPGKLSGSEVQRLAQDFVTQTAIDRKYVQQRLDTHGDIIMSRWKKKKGKRQTILRGTEPRLYQGRWFTPIYDYTLGDNWGERRAPMRRWQTLLPWLAEEVLTANAMTLLALLKYRTLYSPQEWALHDFRQIKLPWDHGHLDVQFSAKCVVMHGSQYGRIVNWEAGAAHRSDILGWPRARLILEAQANLLAFLRKVVDRILEGIERTNLLHQAQRNGKR